MISPLFLVTIPFPACESFTVRLKREVAVPVNTCSGGSVGACKSLAAFSLGRVGYSHYVSVQC